MEEEKGDQLHGLDYTLVLAIVKEFSSDISPGLGLFTLSRVAANGLAPGQA